MFEKYSVVRFNSIIAALFVNTACITQILISAFPFGGSFMTIIYVLCTIGVVISSFLKQHRYYFIKNKGSYLMAILLIFVYYITKIFIGPPYTKDQFFLMFTIVSFLIPAMIVIDTRTFLLTILYSSIFGCFYVDKIFILDYNYAISMGESYAFLVPVCAALCYLFSYLKSDSKVVRFINTVVILVNLIYMVYIFQYGSRGPSLCIIMLIVFFLICSLDTNNYHFNKKKSFILIFIVCSLYAAFIPLLMFFSKVLRLHFNLSLNLIDKFIYLNESSDISNGREQIADMTISGIKDSPIWGHGVDLFWINYGDGYPHNFVLQMCYDLGCVFTVLFLLYVIKRFTKAFKNYNRNNVILMVFMLFSSVPGALFSNDLWNNIALWTFFGCTFSKTFCYNRSYDRL